jgi:hypothetical protein
VTAGTDAPLGSITAPLIAVCAPIELAQTAIRNNALATMALQLLLTPATAWRRSAGAHFRWIFTHCLQSQNVSRHMSCICRGVRVPISEVV